ncbi:MAG: hypothetical protein H7332_03020 [Bdellovibrionales bacterium]|nr:hypothetical protein [Ramlibacter sp.]
MHRITVFSLSPPPQALSAAATVPAAIQRESFKFLMGVLRNSLVVEIRQVAMGHVVDTRALLIHPHAMNGA